MRWVAGAVAAVLAIGMHIPAWGAPATPTSSRATDRRQTDAPRSFTPAVAAMQRLGRYFVVMHGAAVADAEQAAATSGARLGAGAQQRVFQAARGSQAAAIDEAHSLGGRVVFRDGTRINGFSAQLTPAAAAALARRPDVATVEPVGIVKLANSTSVPFIGATKVWHQLGVKGQGIKVADVDTGIDYTHKDFGGPGTVAAYKNNNPTY
ncbi:MAG: hypothetical protein QOF16_1169, partial [Actinomycetota bacterium]|nr:hypothetical protein [Actinomycetota bacterium]